MFRVLFLERLSKAASIDAIKTPLKKHPIKFTSESIEMICEVSDGYPYFIQFMCRETYDVFVQQKKLGQPCGVPLDAIIKKLDTDFFAGRWARATDRQRQLLWAIAQLENPDSSEFTVQEIVAQSKAVLAKPFSASHVNQMLSTLSDNGLTYKNRHGKYSFAVPLLGRFILRQGQPLPI